MSVRGLHKLVGLFYSNSITWLRSGTSQPCHLLLHFRGPPRHMHRDLSRRDPFKKSATTMGIATISIEGNLTWESSCVTIWDLTKLASGLGMQQFCYQSNPQCLFTASMGILICKPSVCLSPTNNNCRVSTFGFSTFVLNTYGKLCYQVKYIFVSV